MDREMGQMAVPTTAQQPTAAAGIYLFTIAIPTKSNGEMN
jgi:hypothetical protein